MDKYLRPKRFDCDPSSTGADKEWKHLFKTFETFLVAIDPHKPNKFVTLTNYIAPDINDYTAHCDSNNSAIHTLKALHQKPLKEIYARHVLATRKQEDGKTLNRYLQALKRLSKIIILLLFLLIKISKVIFVMLLLMDCIPIIFKDDYLKTCH